MAFWGVEIKPGKTYTHRLDIVRGRLHISQATLGTGPSTGKVLVQCNVGDKSPIFLCALIPDNIESCPLDLEFEEDDEVIFSILGPQSVHLTGYYLGNGHECNGDSDDTDCHGEDIAEYDTEQSTEDEYEDDLIDGDDFDMFPPSPRPNSGVVIEEILDDEHTANGIGHQKHLKKKFQMSDSDGDDQRQIVVKHSANVPDLESEDEDGFPITSLSKSKPTVKNTQLEEKSYKKIAKENKKKAEDGGDRVTVLKRKIDTIVQDDEAGREFEQPNDSSMPSSEIGHENGGKLKKKKKERTKEGKTPGIRDDDKSDVHKEDKPQAEVAKNEDIGQDQPVRDEHKEKLPNNKKLDIDADHALDEDHVEMKKKKKKKKKKSKAQESEKNANTEEEGKEAIVEIGNKKAEVKPSQARTFSNGLVIEELEMGKPDGKRASPGNKVSVHYIGKLKEDGQVFDSSVGGAPFKFRLGVGQVIKGWDVGVNGMRIGDKRRITIPPSMGYGSEGAGGKVPPNAWLVFEVVLVDV